MAKRSDFAQKLLDDLRLRKERMAAAASQSSKGSKSMAGDAYTYSKQTYSGSRDMRTNQTNGFSSGSSRNRSSGASKSFSIEAASKQIVPFGRGQRSEQMGDLSRALAFAFENGGKLKRVDASGGKGSILGFLNQIGRQSVELRMTERSIVDRNHHSTRSPTLSHLHIKEIAKGVQRLNEILRTCSNGINFDNYSIEIGEELMKGALGLEESLRMLVNLQEASDYMIKPQNKNRIKLLDEEEDDDDDDVDNAGHMQLDRPRFSFDKPSRNSHYMQGDSRMDLKQRLLALTYLSEAANSNHDRHSASTPHSASHKRSKSHVPSVKAPAAFSEQKSQSNSSKLQPEKARIPNVIAKLMGLEELPEKEESKYGTKKESSSKQKIEGQAIKKSAEGSSIRQQKIEDAAHLASTMRKQKQIQHNHVQSFRDTHSFQEERNLAVGHANLEVTSQGRIQMRGSNKTSTKMDRIHQNGIAQSNQIAETRKAIHQKEKKQENAKIREQKGKEERETKHLQQMVSQTQTGSQAAIALQRHTDWNLSMHTPEKRDEKLPSYDKPKSPNRFQQQYMNHDFEQLEVKHYAEERGHQGTKQNLQVRRQKEREEVPKILLQPNQSVPVRSSTDSIDEMHSRMSPNRYHERNSSTTKMDLQYLTSRNPNENSSPRDQQEEFAKEKTSFPSVYVQEKSVHLPTPQKAKNPKVQKVEMPLKIDELMARRNGTASNLSKLRRHQTSNEVKQRKSHIVAKGAEKFRIGRSKEAETCIIKSSKSAASIQKPNKLDELHIKADQIANLDNLPPPDHAFQSLEAFDIHTSSEQSQSMIPAMKSDHVSQDLDFDNEELNSHNILEDPLTGNNEDSTNIISSSQQEIHKVSNLEPPEPLTESEIHLKQILIKSQLFLNTAEALFKLNIPYDVLHAGTTDQDHCDDAQSKLTLDASYEVLRRKGKTQELILHPLMKIPMISSINTRSLDELIKQLDKDLKKLEFYGRNGNTECGVEDYLPKMLESDVYNKDPDLNSMWEFGWDNKMFGFVEKDEVARDVEKFVLNGILDEVTRDLVLVF